MSETAELVWHRLHPAMLLFQLAGILRRYFLLFIVGGVASSRGENFVYFILLSSALALTVGMLRYFSYRYAIEEKYLTVTFGVISKNSRRFMLDKINHVSRHQNPLAKLMGLVRLEIQQEASNLPALTLPAVTFKQAEEIERVVQLRSSHVEINDDDSPSEASAGQERSDRKLLYQGSLGKSLLEGVSSFPVGLLALIAIMYRYYGQAVTPFIVDEYALYVDTLNGIGISRDTTFWLFVAVSTVCLYLIALAIGTMASVVRRFRYRVAARSGYISIVSGAFTRSTRVINPQQIQAILGNANPIRRCFNACQWQIVAPRPGRQRGTASQLLPIGQYEEIAGVLPALWSNCNYPLDGWLAVDAYHRRRLWMLTLLTTTVLLTIITEADSFFNPLADVNLWLRAFEAGAMVQIALLMGVVLLWALFRCFVQVNYNGAGYKLDEGYIFIKSAFLVQRFCVVPLEKIQAVVFSRSPMQRLRGLVTIELDINGILRPVRLYNVSNELAEQIREKVIAVVNRQNN